jgi:cell division protein FtsW
MDLVGRLPFGPRPAPRPRGGGRNVAGAARRWERGLSSDAPTDARSERRVANATAATRPAARTGSDVLRRERHQADYSILLAVVSLAAIGILMVFSSSAMRAYIDRDDSFFIVGPQIFWAGLGILAMVTVMRMDYRWLRLVSVPGYAIALGLLILVFVPSLNRVVGGSARWLVVGPLPAVHPAEIAKLALVIYLAHWMANKGRRISGFRSGTVPFLLIALPVIALVFKEPDLGTTVVIALAAFTMFFVAGASLVQLGVMGGIGFVGVLLVGLRDYQIERIRTFLDPWADPLGTGFHTIQGLLALGLGGIFGTGLGESKLAGGLYLPNAWNDFIFAIIGEEFGFLGAGLVIGLFILLAYAGIRTALRAPDTFGALLAAGITAWLCCQAFVNIAVVVALLPVTGITLPFISAGGSSLVVSFAAAGILLSISRETLEKQPKAEAPARAQARGETRGQSRGDGRAASRGETPDIRRAGNGTRRSDAIADRGRGDRGTHLPGTRRRGVDPSPTRRS